MDNKLFLNLQLSAHMSFEDQGKYFLGGKIEVRRGNAEAKYAITKVDRWAIPSASSVGLGLELEPWPLPKERVAELEQLWGLSSSASEGQNVSK